MASSPLLRHTRAANLVFRLKATGLQLRRSLDDLRFPVPRHHPRRVSFLRLLAESRTPLWTSPELSERRLQLGKAQNLRLALQKLDGVVLPAGAVFSFWKQVGRATRRRGFVAGRELREGCLIPAVGGGLCQLSNALYAAALQSGCEILERHPHSQIVPGSAAELGKDATVFWNYLDLRFRAPIPLRLELRLTADELLVRFWSDHEASPVALRPFQRIELLTPRPRGCDSCGEDTCDQHNTPKAEAARRPLPQEAITAFVVEERWAEHESWVTAQKRPHDHLLLPLARGRYAWETTGFTEVHTATVQTVLRSLAARKPQTPPERRAAQLLGADALAQALGAQVPPEATHLIVTQALLPYLWRDGWLGGRTFDVLMTRMPLATLHRQLDEALARRPEAPLLADYRAPEDIVALEAEALTHVRQIVTPHSEIAALFPEQVERLAWQLPKPRALWQPTHPRTIAFAGPTAARKGAYAVREVALALGLTVRLRGSELEGPEFWNGVSVEHTKTLSEWLEGVVCVVQPAVVEDAPRALLYALAAGAPVFASPACGLSDLPGVWGIAADSSEALLQVLPPRVLTDDESG